MTPSSSTPAAAVLAVDGGNSKADLALVTAEGDLVAAVHGPSISHQAVGLGPGMARLVELAAECTGGRLARPIAELGVYALAGADYPEDVRLLRHGIEEQQLTPSTMILNDTFGALRAGTHRPWGVVLICGQGINGAAVAPDGRSARFDGVGEYSGDWGGGGGVAREALAAAVRGRDGRGPRTRLERLIPAYFGLRSPAAVTKAFYFERIPDTDLPFMAPLVFEAAGDDAVARSIIDRLADELIGMAAALIRRLRLGRLDPEVVLAGGVFKTDDRAFHERLETGIRAAAPRAQLRPLTAPPVLGAALIGLDRLAPGGAVSPAVEARLRAALEAWAEG